MESRAAAVADLLESVFHITSDLGSLDQAEYILSISDMDDVREWLTDALALDPEDPRLGSFMEQLGVIKSANSKPMAARPLVSKARIMESKYIKSPVHVDTEPTPPIPAPLPPRPKVPKVIPKARSETRSQCSCVAKVELGGHPLIGNCLKCGRVICQAEDYGNCLFCGCDEQEIHWLDLYDEIDDAVVAQKNRLIQYDREGASRTKVYDDSTDWFAESSDVWKGKEEREEAMRLAREFEEKKRLARNEMHVEIDFSTGQIKVQDKEVAIHAVEAERDKQLADWIEGSNKKRNESEVLVVHPGKDRNVLDKESAELLEMIREKLGTREKLHASKPVSIFSCLDDDQTFDSLT